MMIHATVVHSAHVFGAKRLLEPTNEAYAIAKIAGIKLCQSYRTQYGSDFISAMPPNSLSTSSARLPSGAAVH